MGSVRVGGNMARTLTFVNETHWKTSDVSRIVKAALAASGADSKRRRYIYIKWSGSNATQYWFEQTLDQTAEMTIELALPRRGPKTLHPKALIALAAASIDTSTPMLAPSDSWFIANALYYEFCGECFLRTPEDQIVGRSKDPPSWANASDLIITKYADPAKDGAYLDFVAKKEKEIATAQARVEKWRAEGARVQKNLKRAERDLRRHQKSLRESRKRRS